MDLISRQAAIDEWRNDFKEYVNALNIPRDDYKGIMAYIDELPSAQPEIIMCKNCKHWLDIDDGRQKHSMCADVYGNWFCADAERREE